MKLFIKLCAFFMVSNIAYAQISAESEQIQNHHAEEKVTGSERSLPNENFFIGVQIGPQFLHANETLFVENGMGFPPPYHLDAYSAHSDDASVLLGLSLGYRAKINHSFLSAYALSLQYQHFFTAYLQGNITEFSLPAFENYQYRWGVESNLLFANAKLNLLDYQRFAPYVNLGLGVAFNQTRNYTETALGFIDPRISPSFKQGSTPVFAYVLGAGLDYVYTSNLIFNVGYQFTDLGSAKSGQGQGSWAGQSLALDHHVSNALLFGVSYLFDGKGEPGHV